MLGVILGLNLAVLIPWTIVDPLVWTRTYLDATDIFDRQVESYGSCSNQDSLPYIIVILILNVGLLLVANWWSYQSRNIETEYHESRYIGISMASVLQAWCMGVPILIVVWDNPSAKFFVEAGIVFVTALVVLLLIFTPKVLAIRSERIERAQEEKRGAYNKFQARARNASGNYDDDDSEEDSKAIKASAGAIAAGVQVDDESKFAPKDSSSTAGATNSSEFTKPPPQEASNAGAAATAGVAAAGVAAVGVAAVAASNKESDHSNSNSFRRSTTRASLSARLLQGGAMKSDEATENMGGIKILHNPRVSCTVVERDEAVTQIACAHLTSYALFVGCPLQSERNLRLSGGQELSRDQLMSLEDDDDDDDEEDSEIEDEDGSIGVVEEDAAEADVEEAREQQQQEEDGDVEAGDAGEDQNKKTQPEQSQ